VLAALGGVVFLNDHLGIVNVLGIAIAAGGLFLLAEPANNKHVLAALCVSLTIGIYSTVDSHGSRVTGGNLYPLTIFMTGAFFISLHGLAMGRAQEMKRTLRTRWKPLTVTACASVLTYWMVLLAVQRASVGYVIAIRESSVVLAALFGWKVLKEGDARRRITAAGVVLLGLVILVAS
jgi:drug/metabolite transporter (DMT)-like permease